jgi:thiol-disulfide isomerase/thioredoxin
MRYLALLAWLTSFAAHADVSAFSSLTDLSGTPASITQEKDKRLVVFWATWCEECRSKLSHELPELNARKDVSVVTINTDKDEERAKDFVKKENIALPVLRDPTKNFRKELKVFSVPHWALYKKVGGEFRLVASQPAFDYAEVMKLLGTM